MMIIRNDSAPSALASGSGLLDAPSDLDPLQAPGARVLADDLAECRAPSLRAIHAHLRWTPHSHTSMHLRSPGQALPPSGGRTHPTIVMTTYLPYNFPMTMSERDLLDQYGAAVVARNASLFVGAGMSIEAGFPNWPDLLEEPRKQAGIPINADLPLMAQYFVISTHGGRAALESHILKTLSAITPTPTKGHKLIRRLGVGDIWTTNYECLLEEAIPEALVVTSEDDLANRRVSSIRQITKMHGSLENSRPSGWLASPIITRSDYEQYEMLHPRMWASLKATYMTRTFLFLGFSFSDPNIEILLRLSRTLLNVGAPEHFTVIKRPDEADGADNLRDHDLRVQDLESSGIAVHEIGAYADIVPLLERMVQRTRRERLFVSGSAGKGPADVRAIGKKIGHRLAETSIEIVSLAGDAGFAVSFPFGYSLRVNGTYDPERIKFYFRQADSAAPLLEQRMGRRCTQVGRGRRYSMTFYQNAAAYWFLAVGKGRRTRSTDR